MEALVSGGGGGGGGGGGVGAIPKGPKESIIYNFHP